MHAFCARSLCPRIVTFSYPNGQHNGQVLALPLAFLPPFAAFYRNAACQWRRTAISWDIYYLSDLL